MKIYKSYRGIAIDAKQTMLIGFGDSALTVDADIRVEAMLDQVVHANTFGTGWMGRMRLAWYVYRQAGIVQQRVKKAK